MNMFGKRSNAEPVPRRRPTYGDMQEQGGRPGQAFSYHAKRSYDPANTGRQDSTDAIAARTASRPPTFFGRHAILLRIAAVVGLPVILYALALSGQPRVTLLSDDTTAYFLQDKTVYQQSAERSLGRSLFNRNKLTIDTAETRLDLLQNYPEIKNTSIVLPVLGHHPEVYIEPYKPSFILTTANGNAFLLDATGRALAAASQIPNLSKLHVPTLQDRSGIEVKLGSRALPSTTVSFVQTVVAGLKAANVSASSLVLPANAYELDTAIAGTPYFVKFNLQGDPLQQTGTYLAARDRLTGDHTPVTQYFDVRVPERAYYK